MTDTTSEPNQTGLVAFLDEWDNPPLLRPLLHLVADGDPVPLDRLADAAGLPVEQVEARLRAEPGVDWNDDGHLLGFGLTQRPTKYRFVLGDRVLYTFCAADTLIFPVLLGRAAVVESACAATGTPIRIEVTPEAVTSLDPFSTVVSQVRLCTGITDVRASVCDHGHFYATPDAAEMWRRDHADGEVVPVADYFAQIRDLGPTLRTNTEEAS